MHNDPNIPKIRIKSPQPNPPINYPPRSPTTQILSQPSIKNVLTRTNSQSKPIKKISLQKNTKQKDIQKQLKFNKINKQHKINNNDHINNQSIQHGHYNSCYNILQDSVQTVQKSNYRSSSKNSNRRQASSTNKQYKFNDYGQEPSFISSNRQKQQQYYSYWKSKAHQYLQNNINLTHQLNSLTKQNQKLKQQLLNQKSSRSRPSVQPKQQKDDKEDILQMMRKNNIYYLNKIQQLQKQLKHKQILIQSLNTVINDQSKQVTGDNQRIVLMNKMKEEIQNLRKENQKIKGEIQKYQEKDIPYKEYKEEYARHKGRLKQNQYKKT